MTNVRTLVADSMFVIEVLQCIQVECHLILLCKISTTSCSIITGGVLFQVCSPHLRHRSRGTTGVTPPDFSHLAMFFSNNDIVSDTMKTWKLVVIVNSFGTLVKKMRFTTGAGSCSNDYRGVLPLHLLIQPTNQYGLKLRALPNVKSWVQCWMTVSIQVPTSH